jgi:hypothetical protein
MTIVTSVGPLSSASFVGFEAFAKPGAEICSAFGYAGIGTWAANDGCGHLELLAFITRPLERFDFGLLCCYAGDPRCESSSNLST